MTDKGDRRNTVAAPGKSGYELTDISTRVVVVFATALVLAGVIIHLLVWLLFAYFGQAAAASYSRQFPLASTGPPPLPTAPVLQVKPREDLRELRAEEDRTLSTYGWVDPSAGIVRIPIDRAMQLVLERGLPTRTPGGNACPAPAEAGKIAGTTKQGAAAGPIRK
jgi:hypothetical protein